MEYDYETEPEDIIREDIWTFSMVFWFVVSILAWSSVGLFFIAQYNNWQHSKHPVVIVEPSSSQISCDGFWETPIIDQSKPRQDM